jgi:hypothetical protein
MELLSLFLVKILVTASGQLHNFIKNISSPPGQDELEFVVRFLLMKKFIMNVVWKGL